MEMEERLLKVLSKFGYVNNHIEDLKLYEDLGLDSLKRTELICEIENEFGFEFELDELNPEKMGTIGKIFNIVKKQTCKMMV